jgi:hypothetical protein
MAKIEKFKKLFKCKVCLNLLVDPVILPCEETICRAHSEDICAKPCSFCDQEHSMPEKGFTLNRMAREMIELEVNNISVKSQSLDQSMRTMDEITAIMAQIDSIKNDPKVLISENFKKLRVKVELNKNSFVSKLESWYEKINEEINQAESKCEAKILDIDDALNSEEINEETLSFKKLIQRLENFEIGLFNFLQFFYFYKV